MRSSSHSLNRILVTFDDDHAVANAGLIQPATLAEHLGLRELFDEYVHLDAVPGHANVGLKAMTLIYSALAGGDCIEDADRMRVAATTEVLGHGVRAASTLGTFLRSFTWGHVAQLDRVFDESIRRSWAAGAGPGQGPVTLDVDSTICETYGLSKQGARFGYTNVRGYHPLLAAVAGTQEVVGVRLRGGNANTGRGVAGFLTQVFNRVRRAGATGPMVLRADSGFYSSKVTEGCRKAGVSFSITVRTSKAGNAQGDRSHLRGGLDTDPVLDRWRRRCGRDDLPAVLPKASRGPPHCATGKARSGQPAGAVFNLRLPRLHYRP